MGDLRERWITPIDREAFGVGCRQMRPFSIAIAIWGVVTGVAMVRGGLSQEAAGAMSLVAYAGSAQLAVLPLMVARAPVPVIVATAALVNLRFVISGAACRRFFIRLPWRQRLTASYFNGDVGFAMFMARYGRATEAGTPEQFGWFWGVGLTNWSVWHVSSLVGIAIAGLFPSSWGLDLAAVLALVAVLVPMMTGVPAIAGVLATAVFSLVLIDLPMRLGVLAAVVIGVSVALGVEQLAAARAHVGSRSRQAGAA